MTDKHAEPLITADMVFGWVELQQRPLIAGNKLGYESRKVTKDKNGVITDIGPWSGPLVWLVVPPPEQKPVPWESFFKRYCPWLEQPEQEPVGKIGWAANRPNTICEVHWIDMPPVGTKLYTTPPQRKPLTVEEIKKLIHPIVMADLSDEMTDFEIVRAIEAAHGIGEKK